MLQIDLRTRSPMLDVLLHGSARDLGPAPRSTRGFASLWFAPLAVAAVTTLTGCPDKYPSCKKDKDCNAVLAEKCVANVCQGCTVDADCVGKAPEGNSPFVCKDLRCQDPAAAAQQAAASGGGEEGDPCAARSDCLGGLACKAGQCGLCTGDADCNGVPCTIETGRCSPVNSCTSDEQCAMDEICDGGMCIFSGDLGDEDGGPCGLAAVYFAFDSEVLTPKTQEDLKGVAACIADVSGAQGKLVYLEAHADNRGTEEYNILLTERRGTSVKNFLAEQGVGAEAMQVISKGSLEAVGSDEATRSKERRVQFIWP
jgi:peptidoglycan-associated lipoprotein